MKPEKLILSQIERETLGEIVIMCLFMLTMNMINLGISIVLLIDFFQRTNP